MAFFAVTFFYVALFAVAPFAGAPFAIALFAGTAHSSLRGIPLCIADYTFKHASGKRQLKGLGLLLQERVIEKKGRGHRGIGD